MPRPDGRCDAGRHVGRPARRDVPRASRRPPAGDRPDRGRGDGRREHELRPHGHRCRTGSAASSATTPRSRTATASPAIVAFLEDRVGYCEQFSGTFAAMARTLGIPARVAVGFTPGPVRRRRVSSARTQRPCLARGVVRRLGLGAVRTDTGPRTPRRRGVHRHRSRSPRPATTTAPTTTTLPPTTTTVAGSDAAARPARRRTPPPPADHDPARPRALLCRWIPVAYVIAGTLFVGRARSRSPKRCGAGAGDGTARSPTRSMRCSSCGTGRSGRWPPWGSGATPRRPRSRCRTGRPRRSRSSPAPLHELAVVATAASFAPARDVADHRRRQTGAATDHNGPARLVRDDREHRRGVPRPPRPTQPLLHGAGTRITRPGVGSGEGDIRYTVTLLHGRARISRGAAGSAGRPQTTMGGSGGQFPPLSCTRPLRIRCGPPRSGGGGCWRRATR